MKIPFSKVDCSGLEMQYIAEVLESGWLTTASKAQQLEKKFEAMIGCNHALAVNSCTSALHLALDAVGVKRGDVVLVPSYTFTATAEVVRYMGATPILLDVSHNSFCIESEELEKKLRLISNVSAVVAVHFGGYPLDLENDEKTGIWDVCKAYNIPLIGDAAHALPAKRNGTLIGELGDITCFSFYANKTMTTGEGGMLLTNSDVIADRVKLMRLHGIDRDVWNRFTSFNSSWEYDVKAPGYKYNMPDLNAAIGLAQLERLESMRDSRQKCAEYYYEHLNDLHCIRLPYCDLPMEDHAWHLFPILIKENSKFDRNTFIEKMKEFGVGTSVHYKPIHRMSYYRDKYNLCARDFPVCEELWETCVSLPIYSLMSKKDLIHVVKAIRGILS